MSLNTDTKAGRQEVSALFCMAVLRHLSTIYNDGYSDLVTERDRKSEVMLPGAILEGDSHD